VFSFCPKFAALISAMPAATIGGISMILYGMISAVGVRNVVENKVDFTNTRNLVIAAVIMVTGLGFNGIGGLTITIGSTAITLTGLALAAIFGIVLNAVLPGKDFDFEKK
jgi:uracil permease